MYCVAVENKTEGSAMLLNFVFKNLNCTTSNHTHLLLGNSGWGHEILWSMGVLMRYNNIMYDLSCSGATVAIV